MFEDTQVDQPELQEEQAPEAVEQTQQLQAQESDKEKNMRNLRELKQKAEAERDEALRLLQESQRQTADDDDVKLNPDDLVEWKHVQKKIAKLEKQIKDSQSQSAEVMAEARLKAQYPDFEKILSKDNVELLKESEPELYTSIQYNPDMYSKAVAAYKAIKKHVIIPEDNYSQEREMAKKNASKPKPLASIAPQQGDTPLSRANAFANGLTEELKAQLRKEMEEARKSL